MEVYPPDWPVVLIKLLQKDPHPVVPQLYHSRVEAGQDPAARRVEAESLHSGTLRVQFSEHTILLGRVLV